MAETSTTSSSQGSSGPDLGDLHEASRAGDFAAIRRLLDAGAPAEQMNPEGKTPLMLAALNGHEAVVALLLERGAAAATVGEMGWSVLHFAAVHEGNGAILRALRRAGAAVDARDPDDCTPLLLAASGGCLENVRCLLDLGADIDALNAEIDTPLSCACRLERTQVAQMLIARGADVSRSERHLVSPLHWAVGRGDNARISSLLDHGAAIDDDPPGCPPLVAWITRPGLSEATVERILRGSGRVEAWMDVLKVLVERSRRPELAKLLERVRAGAR